MADKKVTHNITLVDSTTNSKEELLAVTKKNATPYRIGAVILWILGLVCEVFAVLIFTSKIKWSSGHTIAWIGALVLDLILVVIGSLLWKKANHMDPASEKNKTKFWIQNNLGVIIAVIAFIPFVIIALTNKEASKKDKTIAAVVGIVALLICSLFGIEWNPASQEEMLENAGIEDSVYWTESGTVYHAFEDCPHLNHSQDLMKGSRTAAIEAGKTRMCKTCEKKLADDTPVEDRDVSSGTSEIEKLVSEVVSEVSSIEADVLD